MPSGADASWRSAVSMIVFQTGPAALMATGSPSSPASRAIRTPSSPARPPASAAARSSSTKLTTASLTPDQTTLSSEVVGCHTVTTSAGLADSRPPALSMACLASSDPVVADKQWALISHAFIVSPGLDGTMGGNVHIRQVQARERQVEHVVLTAELPAAARDREKAALDDARPAASAGPGRPPGPQREIGDEPPPMVERLWLPTIATRRRRQ
jgi:hypothetical protein